MPSGVCLASTVLNLKSILVFCNSLMPCICMDVLTMSPLITIDVREVVLLSLTSCLHG